MNAIIALGTVTGKILIYSLAEQDVKETFQHSEHSPIKSLCWSSSSHLISLGKKSLIAWEKNKGKLW